MANVIWVDNSIGNDLFNSLTHETAVKTINGGITAFQVFGGPGDTLRICHTGIDYTQANWRDYLDNETCAGTGWGEDERITLEGYDPSGGNSYPTLLSRGQSWGSYCLKWGGDANYWLVQNL